MEKEQHKSFFLSVFAFLKENLYDNNREKLSEFDIQNTGMGRWLNKRKTVICSDDNGLDNGKQAEVNKQPKNKAFWILTTVKINYNYEIYHE